MINFLCPVCNKQLIKIKGCLKCLNGHCFDIAKEGYVNLLKPEKKNSAMPGDNKTMVRARENFLSKGYYLTLAEKISEILLKNNCQSILDCGCGTGYYGKIFIEKQKELQTCSNIYGIDISKEAVRICAKKGYTTTAVASVFQLPFDDKSFDALFNIFAPLSVNEALRVLKPSGTLICVYAAPNHLFELKKLLYGESVYLNPAENAQKQLFLQNDRLNDNPPTNASTTAFTLKNECRITEIKKLQTQEDILSLFEMTPYLYKTGHKQAERLYQTTSLECTFDFYVCEYIPSIQV